MAYKRITEDVWEVQQKVCGKWTYLCTKKTMKEAHDRGREYERADPKGRYRILKKRIRVEPEATEGAEYGV